ncbi:MAG: hypothetical protein Q4B42_02860, partial [Oscillospiraceae bacterium]|nr:hypothetical protein [Oscillospiraceae bacterium]
MKKLVLKLLCFTPIIIAVLITNIIVDPARIFTRNFEKDVASLLAGGEGVQFSGDMDERTLQIEIVSMQKNRPNT